MPLSAGDKLGPYEILASIGKGGMGEVWKARDTRLDRVVAIKVSQEHFSERFEREAKVIGALNHPNICTLHDVGPNYLVMEYVEGAQLKGPLPLDQALKCAVQICAALDHAHNKGITHRDLKPANILVTASGVKLLDFGLAKIATHTGTAGATPGPDGATLTMGPTKAGAILGTAAYMSPEQAKGEEANARSDIFSFGLVLYEMLSGRQAFARNSAIETMVAIVRDEPAPLDAPAQLSAVVTRCLRKAPAERFQSIAEVKKALEQIATKAEPEKPQPSIAVLPFANMSPDKENEYFSDGLAEEILNLLAKIPNLKVIARTSSFSFRGKEQDIRKIAEALNVSHVLEGSVRRAGNRLRVTAQLIHAADGAHLWSERYDRDMTDVFAIQDEIGQAISEALQVRLAPRARAVNIEAYQSYLKGQYYLDRYTPESMARAKECFEQAAAIDPNYAAAHGGLTQYYFLLATLGVGSAGDVAPLAKSAAAKALAIDPADSEANSALAMMAAVFDYDWGVAEKHYRKAMSVEPVPPIVRLRYILWYLLPLGRFAEAMEQSRLTLETDPLSMVLHLGMARSMYRAKQYAETIKYARKALEIDANYYLIWLTMGLAQFHAGLTQEAIASLKRGVELAPWFHIGEWSLAAVYHLAGDHKHGQESARKLTGSRNHSVGAAFYYAATGETESMFAALDTAYSQRDPLLISVQYELLFDPYRADPRFQSLLAKMNLA